MTSHKGKATVCSQKIEAACSRLKLKTIWIQIENMTAVCSLMRHSAAVNLTAYGMHKKWKVENLRAMQPNLGLNQFLNWS